MDESESVFSVAAREVQVAKSIQVHVESVIRDHLQHVLTKTNNESWHVKLDLLFQHIN